MKENKHGLVSFSCGSVSTFLCLLTPVVYEKSMVETLSANYILQMQVLSEINLITFSLTVLRAKTWNQLQGLIPTFKFLVSHIWVVMMNIWMCNFQEGKRIYNIWKLYISASDLHSSVRFRLTKSAFSFRLLECVPEQAVASQALLHQELICTGKEKLLYSVLPGQGFKIKARIQ